MGYGQSMRDGKSVLGRQNNFGALRLLFALMVIISHAPQELDGNFSREPLVRLFHTVSLGTVAVSGFFVISGFLVTESFLASGSVWSYGWKRILRIYPGFLVAFLFCVVVVAPLAAPGILAAPNVPAVRLIINALTLSPPGTPPGGGAEFSGLPWSMLNVPMWTIAYEARCYIFVAVAGAIGLLRHRQAMLGLTVLLLAAKQVTGASSLPFAATGPGAELVRFLFIAPHMALYLTGLFCTGMTCRLYAGIKFTAPLALAAGAALIAWLGVPGLAELGLALFFPCIIFWAAFGLTTPYLARIGGRVDLSYGLYLYAWPVSWLIILHAPRIGPCSLAVATMAGAGLLACCSWFLIERPALALKRRLPRAMPAPLLREG